jgi:hypothetical protein
LRVTQFPDDSCEIVAHCDDIGVARAVSSFGDGERALDERARG